MRHIAAQERLRRGRQGGRAAVADPREESRTAAEGDRDDTVRLCAAGRRGERLRDPGGDRNREARVSREEKEQGRAQGEVIHAAADEERLLRRAPRAELHRASDHAVPVRAEPSACR